MQQSTDAWILSDGRAGNARQARALAAALGLQAQEWTLDARPPWRWLSPRKAPGAIHAFGAAFATGLAKAPPLAIGCGRQAALATRVLREHGARVVQILDPRLAPDHWDVVVAPEHDGLHGANVITLQGSLHPVDDLWLAAARQQFAAFGDLPQPRTALLLGGTSAHATLPEKPLEGWVGWLAAQLAQEGGSVLATASRRTPDSARQLLRERLAGIPGLVWRDERDGPNPYPGLLGWADRIVCTADSVNMLSEAAATNVPVFVLGAEWVRGRPRQFVDDLIRSGRVRPCTEGLEAFPVAALRETARVADAVRARLAL